MDRRTFLNYANYHIRHRDERMRQARNQRRATDMYTFTPDVRAAAERQVASLVRLARLHNHLALMHRNPQKHPPR